MTAHDTDIHIHPRLRQATLYRDRTAPFTVEAPTAHEQPSRRIDHHIQRHRQFIHRFLAGIAGWRGIAVPCQFDIDDAGGQIVGDEANLPLIDRRAVHDLHQTAVPGDIGIAGNQDRRLLPTDRPQPVERDLHAGLAVSAQQARRTTARDGASRRIGG